MKIYVEGGGDTRSGDLATECRRGFSELFRKATGRNFKVVACGSRRSAYDAFALALSNGDAAVLLVDSEDPVTAGDAWTHLGQRHGDGWDRVAGEAHLMVVCMETWLLADVDALRVHFGDGFKDKKIPKWPHLHEVGKQAVYDALKAATKDVKKGAYNKGRDSFKILARLDPTKLAGCGYAQALFACLRA